MIILLRPSTSRKDADVILRLMTDGGVEGRYADAGAGRGLIVARGEKRALSDLHLENHPMVERVLPLFPPYEKALRVSVSQRTTVELGRLTIGGDRFTVIAGPLCVETRRQFLSTAMILKKGGVSALRGGLFRTCPHADSFAGVGLKGTEIVREVARQTGLPVVTEVAAAGDVAPLQAQVACLQVPPEHMSDARLLDAVGDSRLPVILTRGPVASLDELLVSADRILSRGNRQVVLCERGVRTAAPGGGLTLDLRAVPELQRLTHLPVLVDPSCAATAADYVLPLAKAAVVCGADGIIVEACVSPQDALVGGPAALGPARFKQLMDELQPLIRAAGKNPGVRLPV